MSQFAPADTAAKGTDASSKKKAAKKKQSTGFGNPMYFDTKVNFTFHHGIIISKAVLSAVTETFT